MHSTSYLDYKGPTPVDEGDTVVVVDEDGNEHEGVVTATLAVQFIIEVPKQGHMYRFYADRGDTWRPVRKRSSNDFERNNVIQFPLPV